MTQVTPAHIREAHARIAPFVRRTPSLALPRGAFGFDNAFSLKLEMLQHAGSFKTRGAFNSVLSETPRPSAVAAASGGNHGAAVAHVAKVLGLPAKIFVPEISSPAKIARIRSFGAELVIGGARYGDAQKACDEEVSRSRAYKVHPFASPRTIAGAGTVAVEWAEDAALDTVLVAVGGGGLAAGMAAWWQGAVRIVGVEPTGSCALHAAIAAGKPVDVSVNSVAADSLGAPSTSDLILAIARAWIDRVVLVEDDAILDAQRTLWRDYRLAVEVGGAAALAALISGAYRPEPKERIGILLCGANVDLDRLAENTNLG